MNNDVNNIDDEHPKLEDELGAYLLGALDPAEERRVEELLASSESARDRLRYMQPAIELLGETVARHEPPPELRERILTQVGVDRERVPAVSPSRRRPWSSFRGFSLQPAFGMAALALVAIAVGVAGYEVGMGGDDSKPRGDGSRTFPGRPQPGTVTAKLERKGDTGTLQLTGLKPLSPYRDYQAWVQHDGVIEPASLFAAREDGTASAAIPQDINGAQAVVVTVEPRGGSRTPTGPILTRVPLSG